MHTAIELIESVILVPRRASAHSNNNSWAVYVQMSSMA